MSLKPGYILPAALIKKVANLAEFANGGTQVTIKLKNGTLYTKALISNCTWIIAMRGYKELPFSVADIEDVFQSADDVSPERRGGWDYWDDWGSGRLPSSIAAKPPSAPSASLRLCVLK